MKYRDIIGYPKKTKKVKNTRKVVKEVFKPTVLDNIKEEFNLTEGTEYAVNVQDTRKNKRIQSGKFTFKDDAKKYIKDMIKKHKLKRQKGFWANPKTGVELITNF
tara:strand:- start:7 stop:321 length:315 start_codon:yes stop_codon:yes gene_type:complete